MWTESRSNGKFALGSAFEGRGRSSFLLLDLPLRHCQRLAGYVDRHSTVVPIPKSQEVDGRTRTVVVVLNLLLALPS